MVFPRVFMVFQWFLAAFSVFFPEVFMVFVNGFWWLLVDFILVVLFVVWFQLDLGAFCFFSAGFFVVAVLWFFVDSCWFMFCQLFKGI